MAQQLRIRGEEVGLLALLDTFRKNWSAPSLLLKLLRLSPRASFAYGLRKARVFCHPGLKYRILQPILPPAWRQIRKAHKAAWDAYVPRPYAGKVISFRASQRSLRGSDDPKGEWSRLAAGVVDVQDVPGDHNTMMTEPCVQVLARQLQACMEKSQEVDSTVSLSESGLTPTGAA
jgi:thioesterase domain-containing protein